MSNNDKDEMDMEDYRERVESVSKLFRRRPHNMIEEIEKLGFTYAVDDDDEDAEDIAEEQAAQPITDAHNTLVFYLIGADAPTEELLTLWRTETRRIDTPIALWRRYFRAGNGQLKKLILFGLDKLPTDNDLLNHLSFLHSFLPMPKELLARYIRACDEETNMERFRNLACDFDESAESFGYDAVQSLRERCADNPSKKQVVDILLAERKQREDEIVTF